MHSFIAPEIGDEDLHASAFAFRPRLAFGAAPRSALIRY